MVCLWCLSTCSGLNVLVGIAINFYVLVSCASKTGSKKSATDGTRFPIFFLHSLSDPAKCDGRFAGYWLLFSAFVGIVLTILVSCHWYISSTLGKKRKKRLLDAQQDEEELADKKKDKDALLEDQDENDVFDPEMIDVAVGVPVDEDPNDPNPPVPSKGSLLRCSLAICFICGFSG